MLRVHTEHFHVINVINREMYHLLLRIMIGCKAIKILYRSGLPFLLVTFVLKLFLYES